jgi:hypothetical protein
VQHFYNCYSNTSLEILKQLIFISYMPNPIWNRIHISIRPEFVLSTNPSSFQRQIHKCLLFRHRVQQYNRYGPPISCNRLKNFPPLRSTFPPKFSIYFNQLIIHKALCMFGFAVGICTISIICQLWLNTFSGWKNRCREKNVELKDDPLLDNIIDKNPKSELEYEDFI